MNRCIIMKPCGRHLVALVLCPMLITVGCADKSAIREQQQAKYQALEEELINAQEARERQRTSQMRVNERLQRLDEQHQSDSRNSKPTSQQGGSASAAQQKLDADPPNTANTATAALTTQQINDESNNTSKDGFWILKRIPDPRNGSPLCVVSSPSILIKNGSLETHVSVLISTESVMLRTDAIFDTNTPESGYRVDSGLPVAFDHFYNELTAVVDNGYTRLLEAIQSGSSLSVFFAYLPQLSDTETHVLELDLATLETPLANLPACDIQGG